MNVDFNPPPPELACGVILPPEIERALRVNQHAAQLLAGVMMGPAFKSMRATAGEDWKPESGELLFGPRLADEVVDGAFRLAESFERRREDEVRDGIQRHKAAGGEWPPKPPVEPQTPFRGMPSQMPLPIVNKLEPCPSPEELADAMREAMPPGMLQRLTDTTDERKLLALQAAAKLYGVDVYITLTRKPDTENTEA